VVYTIMGYRLPADEPEQFPAFLPVTRETRTRELADVCGIFPARSGTAADFYRTLLFTQ
jgi:hypothetical protein